MAWATLRQLRATVFVRYAEPVSHTPAPALTPASKCNARFVCSQFIEHLVHLGKSRAVIKACLGEIQREINEQQCNKQLVPNQGCVYLVPGLRELIP